MHTVSKFEAEQIGEYILLKMEVTSGESVWPGQKAVPVGSDLKVEGELLASEIIKANTEVVAPVVVEPVPVDVSNIVITIN